MCVMSGRSYAMDFDWAESCWKPRLMTYPGAHPKSRSVLVPMSAVAEVFERASQRLKHERGALPPDSQTVPQPSFLLPQPKPSCKQRQSTVEVGPELSVQHAKAPVVHPSEKVTAKPSSSRDTTPDHCEKVTPRSRDDTEEKHESSSDADHQTSSSSWEAWVASLPSRPMPLRKPA